MHLNIDIVAYSNEMEMYGMQCVAILSLLVQLVQWVKMMLRLRFYFKN